MWKQSFLKKKIENLEYLSSCSSCSVIKLWCRTRGRRSAAAAPPSPWVPAGTPTSTPAAPRGPRTATPPPPPSATTPTPRQHHRTPRISGSPGRPPPTTLPPSRRTTPARRPPPRRWWSWSRRPRGPRTSPPVLVPARPGPQRPPVRASWWWLLWRRRSGCYGGGFLRLARGGCARRSRWRRAWWGPRGSSPLVSLPGNPLSCYTCSIPCVSKFKQHSQTHTNVNNSQTLIQTKQHMNWKNTKRI